MRNQCSLQQWSLKMWVTSLSSVAQACDGILLRLTSFGNLVQFVTASFGLAKCQHRNFRENRINLQRSCCLCASACRVKSVSYWLVAPNHSVYAHRKSPIQKIDRSGVLFLREQSTTLPNIEQHWPTTNGLEHGLSHGIPLECPWNAKPSCIHAGFRLRTVRGKEPGPSKVSVPQCFKRTALLICGHSTSLSCQNPEQHLESPNSPNLPPSSMFPKQAKIGSWININLWATRPTSDGQNVRWTATSVDEKKHEETTLNRSKLKLCWNQSSNMHLNLSHSNSMQMVTTTWAACDGS